jgi:hypothetical protein
MFHPLFASQAGAQLLLNALEAATATGSSLLDNCWELFLKGDLYKIVSKTAATLTLVPLSLFVINMFRNRNVKEIEEKFFTGDVISYILVGLIISSLVAPVKTGALLFGARQTAVAYSNRMITSANEIAGDPSKAMASIVAGKTQSASKVQICNRIADEAARTTCIQKIAEENSASAFGLSGGFNGAVTGALSTALGGFAGIAIQGASAALGVDGGDLITLTIVVPFLLTIGTAFILILEIGMLLCCLFVPFVLLIGIADPGFISDWLKAFFSWALIFVAYKLIMVSVAFGMLSTNITDVLLYGIVAGLGAPFLAIEVVSGKSLGLLSGIGSVATKLIGR